MYGQDPAKVLHWKLHDFAFAAHPFLSLISTRAPRMLLHD
jgi:hypothetical protein